VSRIVFLLEEYSMKVFLEALLPRCFPDLGFLCIYHEGKNDLEKSIPRKLRAWQEPGVRFVVIRDNDGANCHEVKARLLALCREGRREDTLVRIACQELEAWYIGDAGALADAFSDEGLRGIARKAKYRDPDAVVSPSVELKKLVPEFQKVSGARAIAPRISRTANRSRSFHVLLEGLDRLAQETGGT